MGGASLGTCSPGEPQTWPLNFHQPQQPSKGARVILEWVGGTHSAREAIQGHCCPLKSLQWCPVPSWASATPRTSLFAHFKAHQLPSDLPVPPQSSGSACCLINIIVMILRLLRSCLACYLICFLPLSSVYPNLFSLQDSVRVLTPPQCTSNIRPLLVPAAYGILNLSLSGSQVVNRRGYNILSFHY